MACTEEASSASQLALRLLRPARSENSLSTVFPKVYADKDFKEYLQTTFEFSLDRGRFDRAKPVPSDLDEADIPAVFEALMVEIARSYPEERTAFFFDDVDQVKSRQGAARLMTAALEAHFVFVCTRWVDLLEESGGAERPLYLTQLPVPPLTDQEVAEVFTGVEERAKGQLRFTREFVDMITRTAYGYPWVVQTLGYQSVKIAEEESPSRKIKVERWHLEQAEERLLRAEMLKRKFSPEALTVAGRGSEALLNILAQEPRGVTVGELRRSQDDGVNRYAYNWLADLIDAGIVRKDSEDRYWFADPMVRLLFLKTRDFSHPPKHHPLKEYDQARGQSVGLARPFKGPPGGIEKYHREVGGISCAGRGVQGAEPDLLCQWRARHGQNHVVAHAAGPAGRGYHRRVR